MDIFSMRAINLHHPFNSTLVFSHYFSIMPWPVHAFIVNQYRTLRLNRKISCIPCHSRARTHTRAHTYHSFVYQEFGKFLPISCQDATCMQQVTLTLNLDTPIDTNTNLASGIEFDIRCAALTALLALTS